MITVDLSKQQALDADPRANQQVNFGSLLETSPPNHIFLKTFNSELQEIKVCFTDQTSNPLEVEDTINLIMIIK